MKVEVAVLGSPSLIVLNGLCGRKATLNESATELRSCVKVEVDVLGSPSLTVLNMVYVVVKQYLKNEDYPFQLSLQYSYGAVRP